MSLVTENESDLSLVQDFGVESERLVGDDEDGVDRPSAKRVHEATEVAVNVSLGAGVDGQGRDPTAQPLADLIVPVLKEKPKLNSTRKVQLFKAGGTHAARTYLDQTAG